VGYFVLLMLKKPARAQLSAKFSCCSKLMD